MTLDILMPFYGRVDQFRSAVESVRAQTSPDWRLVIVDDVYPDTSAGEWAIGLGDPRITYLRNERNLGVSGNFNRCISLIENDFAVIMGCDDVMRPGYVARIAQLRSRYPDTDLLQPGVSVIDQNGEPALPLADRVKTVLRPRGPRPRVLGGEELAASLLRGNWCYFPSLCWRSDRLREFGFREDRRVVQDLTLIMQIVLSGGTLVLDDDVVFDYRRHAASGRRRAVSTDRSSPRNATSSTRPPTAARPSAGAGPPVSPDGTCRRDSTRCPSCPPPFGRAIRMAGARCCGTFSAAARRSNAAASGAPAAERSASPARA